MARAARSDTHHNDDGLAPVAMSPHQYLVVALCCLCNMADGFDVTSMALAAPTLAKQWGIAPALLGTIFGASSLGLSVGAFLVAPMADSLGRRPIMLTAIGSLALLLALTGLSTTILQLVVFRFLTGIGLGTLVVCLNTTVAEISSDGSRNLAMAMLHFGFTMGMMIGSGIAVLALQHGGWRSIFFAAGAINALTFLASLFLLDESMQFLAMRRRPADLGRANSLRKRMRMSPIDAFPARPSAITRKTFAIRALLSPRMRAITLLIWATSLTYAIVGYFLLNWKPTILVNAGLSPTLAAASGIITGACGAMGHLAMGLLARRFGEGRLTAIFFALAAVSLFIFGVQPPDAIPLLAMAGITTLFVVGAYTGLFLVAVTLYPPDIRNSGVGFVVGFTRVGAVAGPMIGGFLMGAGLGRMDVYFIFSAIALTPALTMFFANRLALARPQLSGVANASSANPAF